MEQWSIVYTDGSCEAVKGTLEHPKDSKFLMVVEKEMVLAIINLDEVRIIRNVSR